VNTADQFPILVPHNFQEGICINCGCSITDAEQWCPTQKIPPVDGTEAAGESHRKFREYLQTNDQRISARRHAIEVTGRFARLFLGTPYAYILRYENGRYETIQRNADGSWETRTKDKAIPRSDPWPQAWERHLRGEYPSLLSIPIMPKGVVYFAALDIDRHEGSPLPPLDCAALAKEITRLQLPLVCWRSKNGKGGYLGLFIKDQAGCDAAIVRKALEHYRSILRIEGAEEIFPKQWGADPNFGTDQQRAGNGLNLPYFGSDRVAFGESGEEITVEEFLDLAQRRAVHAIGLSNEVRQWFPDWKPDRDDSQSEVGEDGNARPLPIEIIRKRGEEWLTKLRDAPPGDRHHKLVACSFYFGSAFASGALIDTEDILKRKIWDALTEAWKRSKETWGEARQRLDRESARDGWEDGLKHPQTILDPAKDADESLGWVTKELESPWVIKDAKKKEEFLRRTLKIDRFELEPLYKAIATKLEVSVPGLKSKLAEMRDAAKAPPEVPSDAIVYSLENYATCLRDAEKVLANIPGRYFECDRRLVIPIHARESENKSVIERDGASVIIDNGSKMTVRRDLIDHAHFFEQVGDKLVPIFPPPDIISDIFDRLKAEANEVPYIHLDMLVATPTLLPSGAVHDAPGELRESVLFLAPTRDYPRVPDNPSREDAVEALRRFEPLFCKFPFVGVDKAGQPLPWNQTASYSCVLASGLSLVSRSALRPSDANPITVFNGPKQRSGKTLLVETITIAALSHNPTPVHFHDETEFGKSLLPIIQQQDRSVLIDNVERTIRSAKLAMLVTGNRLRDRILGLSETVDLHNRSVFFTTGNNLSLAGDLASRAVQVSIDPGVERPEERAFDFDPREVAREYHPELVVALLTALRAYILAGKPWLPDREPWGGFAAWDRLVSGCLVWLGYADPVTTRGDVLAEDPERSENINILEAWFDQFKNQQVAVSDIAKNPTTEIYRVLLNRDGAWSPEWVGHRLSRLRNRVDGGKKLIRVGDSRGSSLKRLWQVVEVGATPSEVQEVKSAKTSLF
jgi:hypothetical protein